MKQFNLKTLLKDPVSYSQASESVDMSQADMYGAYASWTVTTPAAVNFSAGAAEVQTLTFAAKASTGSGDYVVVEDTLGNKYAAAASNTGIAQVTTLTAVADVGGNLDGRYFILHDTDGTVGFYIGSTVPVQIFEIVDRTVNITSINEDDTATEVATALATAIHADSKFNASSVGAVVTITNVDLELVPEAIHGNSGFTFATTTFGSILDAEPTGAIWLAVPEANKVQVDLRAVSTAAAVAAAFEVGLNSISGFTAAITSNDTAADGTMTLTQVNLGSVTNAVVKNASDAGAGSISAAETSAGVNDDVNASTDVITEAAHGLITGDLGRLTTTGVLPTGLAAATDYFVIKIDDNNFKLASSLPNALAGTAVNITADGSGVHTFTATALSGASIKLQSYNGLSWVDVATSSNNITTTGSATWTGTSYPYGALRAYVTIAAGRVNVSMKVSTK